MSRPTLDTEATDTHVLIAEAISPEAMAWLGERCAALHCHPSDQRFTLALSQCRALVVRTYTQVDEALLAAAPRLRVVGRAGVGLDNIDLDACRRRGVRVVHTPDANTQAVVEYVLCLLADALRPRPRLAGPVTSAEWTALRTSEFASRQMNECVLGVLGLGRIGSRVAEVARVIGMPVIYNDLRLIPASGRFGAQPVDPAAVFAQSDVVTIHIDGRPENRRFVDEHFIERLKPDAVFINTSRGAVVDHSALARYLQRSPKAKAFLDVHDPEPPQAQNPLWGLFNAVMLPHLASRTETAMRAMSWVVKDVWTALNDELGDA